MMEMKKKTIKEYFDYIQKNISKDGIFLNINRYFSYHSGEQNFLANYPYDENWKILKSKPTNFEKHIHLFLTKRINYKNKNFKKELKKLKLDEFKPTLTQIINNLKRIFSRYEISITKILSFNYLKSLNGSENDDIFEIAEKCLNGLNRNEIFLVKKDQKTLGFFEKFFNFFS